VHGDADDATAFAIDSATGQAKLFNRAATGGNNRVRQAVDPGGKYSLVANYASGTVAVRAIADAGSLTEQHQLASLPGEPGPPTTSSLLRAVVLCWCLTRASTAFSSFAFDPGNGRLTPAEPGSLKTRPGVPVIGGADLPWPVLASDQG
jgi:Lactonase, 7-bladed beta-propeller